MKKSGMDWTEKINLEIQRRAKKPAVDGDVFSLRLKGGKYLYGVVINGKVPMLDWVGVLVYIYKFESTDRIVPPKESIGTKQLLIPPVILDPACWRTGVVETFHHFDLESVPRLAKHCFWDVVDEQYVDELGNSVPRKSDPCGTYGIAPPRGLDNDVSRALGIPLAPD